MYLKLQTFAIILATAKVIYGAEYDVDGFCTLVPDGTKLASIESCQKYYICQKGKAIETKCLSDELSFDKNSQTCKSSSQVKCVSNTIGDKKSCAGISEGYLSVPNSCSGYIYCKNGVEVGKGNCPNGLTFNNGVCDYTKCSDISKVVELTSSCDVIPNNIFFGSTMNCNTYNLCTNDKFSASECPKNFVLDIQHQMCNYQSAGNFCSHVTEKEILPNAETTYPSCSVENEKTSSSSDCSAYYLCKDSKKQKKYCSSGYFFDHDDKTCKTRQLAKPNEKCDRCLGSNKAFVNAVDETCITYLGCSQGVTLYTGKCVDGTYFDEDKQACVPIEVLPAYVATHGACRKSSPNIPVPPITEDTEDPEEKNK